MPRAFTAHEMENIREKLIDAGRVCLEKYGIRKTNVEDLTRAAGISKGAFYKFFNSKEELFFEVMERFEEEFRMELKERLQQGITGTPQEQVVALLADSFSLYRQHPLFRLLNPHEYEALVQKLPPEIVSEHLSSDDDFVAELVNLWREGGVQIKGDVEHVSALIKSLFYISLHADEIGAAFPAAFQTMITLVAGHLVGD